MELRLGTPKSIWKNSMLQLVFTLTRILDPIKGPKLQQRFGAVAFAQHLATRNEFTQIMTFEL